MIITFIKNLVGVVYFSYICSASLVEVEMTNSWRWSYEPLLVVLCRFDWRIMVGPGKVILFGSSSAENHQDFSYPSWGPGVRKD